MQNQLEGLDFGALAGEAALGAITESAARVTVRLGGLDLSHPLLQETAQRLRNGLNKAEHYQALLKAFEARDRSIMEANFTRVNFWSIINSIAMVLVAVVQVRSLRESTFSSHCFACRYI